MPQLDFYTNPMSRGQIVRWMLEEVGAPYQQHIVGYDGDLDSDAYRALNPMRKIPTIVHDGKVVTECAGIIAYLADVFPEAQLAPRDDEKADYYRWLFFAAGPIEQAIVSRSMGWEVPEGREAMVGFGSYERVLDTLEGHLSANDYACGSRFTAADIYVGSQVDWGLTFGSIPPRPAFVAYAERLQAREAYKAAKGIDGALIAEKNR